MRETTKIAVFKGKAIRKIIYNNEWWFSVVDVVQALIDQGDTLKSRKYWINWLNGYGKKEVSW